MISKKSNATSRALVQPTGLTLDIDPKDCFVVKFQTTRRIFLDWLLQRNFEDMASHLQNGLRSDRRYMIVLVERNSPQTSATCYEP